MVAKGNVGSMQTIGRMAENPTLAESAEYLNVQNWPERKLMTREVGQQSTAGSGYQPSATFRIRVTNGSARGCYVCEYWGLGVPLAGTLYALHPQVKYASLFRKSIIEDVRAQLRSLGHETQVITGNPELPPATVRPLRTLP